MIWIGLIACFIIFMIAGTSGQKKNERLKDRRLRIINTGDYDGLELKMGQNISIHETPMVGGEPKKFYESSILLDEGREYRCGGFVGFTKVISWENGTKDIEVYEFPENKLGTGMDVGLEDYHKFFPDEVNALVVGFIELNEYREYYISQFYCVRVDNWKYAVDTIYELSRKIGLDKFWKYKVWDELQGKLKELSKEADRIEIAQSESNNK